MLMIDYGQQVRSLRIGLGLTQTRLAHLAGISLPSIQNIEAGKANPAISTLSALFEVLGLDLRCEPRPANWRALIRCGAPLSGATGESRVLPTREELVSHLRHACAELSLREAVPAEDLRKQEAVAAMLLAIKIHFPALYRQSLEGSHFVREQLPKHITGRMIKLKRQALARLVTYL